jgi:murein DD-endopeptidase MepM/ murein hydrolase activator NlpD
MEKRVQVGFLPTRALPLRSGKLFISSHTLALPHHVGFAPEAVIHDTLVSTAKLLFVWRSVLRNGPAFVLRTVILMLLIFLAIGAKQTPSTLVAGSSISPIEKPTDLQIATKITAGKAPKLVWPVPKTYISSHFSYFHQGIDIPTPYGSPVRSFTSGKVIFAGWDGGFGKAIVIRHKNGLISRYAHLSDIHVQNGEKIYVGNIVGSIGTTGIATGSHLHFEIHSGSGSLNPLTVLP